MSDRMPEDMPDRMPEDLPDRMPEDMPEDMPDRMPDRMPENISDRMPEDLPVTKCINVMVGITRSKVIFFPLTWVAIKKGKMIGYPPVFERPKTSFIVILCYIDVEYKWLKFQQVTVYQDLPGSLLDLWNCRGVWMCVNLAHSPQPIHVPDMHYSLSRPLGCTGIFI